MDRIAYRIRYYRKKRGLTQMEVAAALGIRTDNYSKYESGLRTPRGDRLVALAKILGVSYDVLREGVEREFADLLKRHAIGSVTGEAGSVTSFVSDMELSGEAYYILSSFYKRGEHTFVAEQPQFFQKYLASPDLTSIIELYELYKEQCDIPASERTGDQDIELHYRLNQHLESVTTTKWAFCIAMNRYMERTYMVTILDQAEALAGGVLECFDALQFFSFRVFVPYLSLIIDAVELCMNTNIDDFEKAFLFYALTPPDDWDEDSGDDDE